jgi:cell shape-determining protein MreC
MRKISRTKASRRGAYSRGLWILGAAAAVFLAALILWREPLGGLLLRLYAPLLQIRNALGYTENAELKAQLQGMQALLGDRAVLYEENLYLKRLLGRSAERQIILAGVIMRPPGTPYDTLLIDAGALEGVALGDLVSAGGSALVGRVAQVYEHAARVTLFSAPGQTHEGLLSRGQEVVPVIVEGQGGSSLKTQVPAATGAEPGDTILIPGIATGLTAAVVAVEAGESESFETLYLRLPANPYSLRTVEVWRATSL